MINRRTFLLTSAAGVLRGQAPSGALRILAVGVRGRGGGIALNAAKFGRVVAVCDVDDACTELFLGKLAKVQEAKPEIFKDYRRVLERKDIDIVTIGTPDHWHTAILIDAVKAGKDVYCEKPLTLTIDEGIQICRAVKRSKQIVQVGTQQRSEFKQMFLKAAAIARGGRLGNKLTAICYIGEGRAGGPYPTAAPPSTLNWDMWLGQAPKVEFTPQRCHSTFRWWLEYSGGKLTDWGAHHVDIAHWALGLENTGPSEIFGHGDFPLGREETLMRMLGKAPPDFPNAYNTPTRFDITLKYGNGNTVIIRDGPGNGIRIEGEKGYIFVNRNELTGEVVSAIESDPNARTRLNEEVVKLYSGKEPVSHMQDFVECVRSRKLPISDVFTSHRSITACHLANIAMLVGRTVQWNPIREDILAGDKQALALLKRHQRKPYTIKV
jgi:predicted dehydrogenase